MTTTFPSCSWDKTAPNPRKLASIYNRYGRLKSGYPSNGSSVRAFFSLLKAASGSSLRSHDGTVGVLFLRFPLIPPPSKSMQQSCDTGNFWNESSEITTQTQELTQFRDFRWLHPLCDCRDLTGIRFHSFFRDFVSTITQSFIVKHLTFVRFYLQIFNLQPV